MLTRLRHALIALVIVFGASLALLFCHTAEAAEPTSGTAALAQVSIPTIEVGDAAAAETRVTPGERSAPDVLALCVGLACLVALFVIALVTRALPQLALLLPSSGRITLRPVGRRRPILLALNQICISRT